MGGTGFHKMVSRLFVSSHRIEESSLSSYLYDMHYTTEGSLHTISFIFCSLVKWQFLTNNSIRLVNIQ